MRRFAITAALLIATIGGASAQGIAPNGAVFGQSWALPQDLSTLELTRRAQGSGTAADRAARAARRERASMAGAYLDAPADGPGDGPGHHDSPPFHDHDHDHHGRD